ncbi:MAG: hypothetical protein RLZZ522_251, partial [Verrucomicrobiota bacterium]
MATPNISSEMVNFDPSIEGLDPASVHQVTLASGAVMPIAG